ncbi:probable deoxyhypusine synthase [Pollicipes pollicipes]|uniref:probable deoxyhypusine synthase n=1 Tax=Pollicipes pollicipes TaxID=41117 RepID=UPI001884FA83|nr:probable deoxyhypusine synthase [Pollicipes pollicipes]
MYSSRALRVVRWGRHTCHCLDAAAQLHTRQFAPKKALILTKFSRYEFEKKRHGNIPEAELEKRLKERGSDYNMLLYHHYLHKGCENTVCKLSATRTLTQRFDYKSDVIEESDIVFTMGGDGTFLLGATRILHPNKPIVGINSDPTRSEGHLLLPKRYSVNIKEAVQRLLAGKFRWLFRKRIRMTLIGQDVYKPPVELHNQQLLNPEYRVAPHPRRFQQLAARDQPAAEDDSLCDDEFTRRRSACTLFLGLHVQHVECVVTTAGGVEEDLIKCLADTYVGAFDLKGEGLRKRGINRIGNLLVPNDNYCKFETWVMPILDKLLEEQSEKGTLWSPSRIIERLGREIGDTRSVLYWAAKNSIPVFSPALTDGSLGDMMFFHSYKRPGLVVDILSDLRRLNSMAMKAQSTGMIIIGGGLVKHHICNANLMNGADFSVFVNTASEFDGSDAGARPDEAVSWGKIRVDARPVKVYAEASLVFPLLVAETFARHHFSKAPSESA